MAQSGALATLDDDAIIERIANGEYQSHIAHELGVRPQSLHERISRHPGYRQALEVRHWLKLDASERAIDTSPDLARAREQFRAAAWRAERECPERWGQRQEVTVRSDQAADVLAELKALRQELGLAGRVIDGVADTPNAALLTQSGSNQDQDGGT
jgi:hypothetical protein